MSAAKPDLTGWLKGNQGATLPSPGKNEAKAAEPKESKGFYVPASEIDREWDLGRHLVRIVAAEDYTATSSGKESFKLRLMGLAGAMKNAGIDDYWPKQGKGLRKTHKACKAIGLVDAENDISMPGGAAQMIGRELWIGIQVVNEKRRNEDGEEVIVPANKIGYLSYWAKDEFPVPVEGDRFAEEGQPLPAKPPTVTMTTDGGTVTADAATGEVVGVEVGAAPAF